MYNYNIKQKHMATMNNFFTSKNFELKTRMPTPPKREPVKGKEKEGKRDKTPELKKEKEVKGKGKK